MTAENTQDKVMELLTIFKRTAESGYFKEYSSDKIVKEALDILIGNSEVRVDKYLVKLCVDCFMFGLFYADKDKIREEEIVKRCINCSSLVSRGGQLVCKLDKCKYEK